MNIYMVMLSMQNNIELYLTNSINCDCLPYTIKNDTLIARFHRKCPYHGQYQGECDLLPLRNVQWWGGEIIIDYTKHPYSIENNIVKCNICNKHGYITYNSNNTVTIYHNGYYTIHSNDVIWKNVCQYDNHINYNNSFDTCYNLSHTNDIILDIKSHKYQSMLIESANYEKTRCAYNMS